MTRDEDFEPQLRRMRATSSPRTRKYLHRVIAASARAGAPARRAGRPFGGSRIGRGAALGRLLASRGPAGRRAMVKASYVRLSGKGAAGARAHLRYIERDGVTREGAPGQLYSAGEDAADGNAFLERSGDDRHQFRFIVSAEDGYEYDDLRPLIRRVMEKVEEDLGTRLDWVAVDHHDTAHPHSHILLRGRDEMGRNLVIARDYLSRGLRARVAEQVTLDLGPPSARDIRERQLREVGAERLTSIDRRLVREMDGARIVAAAGGDGPGASLRAGRLRKLARLGLAEPAGGGRWRLAEGIEDQLRAMGERHDIVRTMQRALAARGLERRASERVHVLGPADGKPLVGRLVARGLSDEGRDHHYLIVDGLDGRTHYVDIGMGEGIEPLPEGAIVRLSCPPAGGARAADRTVAGIAAGNGGRYSEELHLLSEPGADIEYVRAHVRRLEAIRRGVGGPERQPDGSWKIGEDHLERAALYEARRARAAPVRVELLSSFPLERLATAEGATWLDRELLSDGPEPLRDAGFGADVRAAKAARRAWLAGQGLMREGQGGPVYRRDLLALLRTREVVEAGGKLAAEYGLPARGAEAGEQVGGVLIRRLDLASGRFGLLQGAGELVLVPWRPGLERRLGRALVGRVGPGGFSWSAGRARGIEIG